MPAVDCTSGCRVWNCAPAKSDQWFDGRIEMVLTGVCRYDLGEELRTTRGYRLIVPNWSRFTDDYADHKTVVDIMELISKLGAYIQVVRFVSSENNIQAKINLDKELLLELINENKFSYKTVTNLPLSNVLVDENLSKNADMITLVGQFKGFFERLFSDASKTKISKDLILPLMIFHH